MMRSGYRRRAFRLSLFTVALIALMALGIFSKREAQTQVSTLPLDFPHVVLLATNSARLQSNVQVVAGHIVVNNASAGPTVSGAGVALGVDNGVLTPAGASVVPDNITISSGVIIQGKLFYNTLTNLGTIKGTLGGPPVPLPIFTPLPVFQQASPGTQDVTVANKRAQTLAPGDYRDIKVASGTTLKLSPGVYNVRSLSVEASAKLLFTNLTATSDTTAGSGVN